MLKVLPVNQGLNQDNWNPEAKRQIQDFNQLQIEEPSNPTSWYQGITKTLSWAQKWAARIQNKLTGAIFGSSENPSVLRQALFQASAIIGKMYGLFDYAVDMQKENKKQEAKTQNLSLPAGGEIAVA